MVVFLIEKTNASLSVCLSNFFSHEGHIPTKSSFSRARSFLCFKAFKRLNVWLCSQQNSKKWKGFRVLSIDGSTLRLPDHSSLEEKFSRHYFGAKKTVARWMSRVSFLYDVLNNVVIDAQMESFEKKQIKWKVVSDFKGENSPVKNRYQVYAIPQYFLLDKERNIIKYQGGFSEEFVAYLVELGSS